MTKRKKPKIIKQKISALYRVSFDDFSERFKNETSPIIKSLKDKKVKPELKEHLKKYLIIRIITMVEDYYRSKACHVTDEYNLDISELLDNISVNNLLAKESNLTKGKILAVNFSFQNPFYIDLVFSKLLNIHFASLVSVFVALLSLVSEEAKGIMLWDDFSNLNELRNNIVHNVQTIVKYDVEEIQVLTKSLIIILAMSETIIEYELESPVDKKLSTIIKDDIEKLNLKTNNLIG